MKQILQYVHQTTRGRGLADSDVNSCMRSAWEPAQTPAAARKSGAAVTTPKHLQNCTLTRKTRCKNLAGCIENSNKMLAFVWRLSWW